MQIEANHDFGVMNFSVDPIVADASGTITSKFTTYPYLFSTDDQAQSVVPDPYTFYQEAPPMAVYFKFLGDPAFVLTSPVDFLHFQLNAGYQSGPGTVLCWDVWMPCSDMQPTHHNTAWAVGLIPEWPVRQYSGPAGWFTYHFFELGLGLKRTAGGTFSTGGMHAWIAPVTRSGSEGFVGHRP